MTERTVDLPILGAIAATRVALGMGVGLLVADKLDAERRHVCGWSLLAIGALSTIPLAIAVLSGAAGSPSALEEPVAAVERWKSRITEAIAS